MIINLHKRVLEITAVVTVLVITFGTLNFFFWYRIPTDCGILQTRDTTPYETTVKVSKNDFNKLTGCFLNRYGGLHSTKIGISNKSAQSGNTYIFTAKGRTLSGVSNSYNQYGNGKYDFRCASVKRTAQSVVFDCEATSHNYIVIPVSN